MFIRFSNRSYEVYVDLNSIVAFGRYEEHSIGLQAVPTNGGQLTIKQTTNVTPTFTHWVQVNTPWHGNDSNRINCSEDEYLRVVEALAPGGGELYDELRQSGDNAHPDSGRNNGVAKLAVSTGKAKADDTKSSKQISKGA